VHMEISFLEIFHKQGLLGVFFWITIFVCICYSFYKADLNGNRKLALPFLLSTIFIYLQTMTNPYLNNPIGMSVVIISLIVLKRLENSAPNLTLT
jgi:O-antigen ligase